MSIEINPLSPALGAEIIGISPCEPLDDEAVSIIRTAWLDYGVVFIRGYQTSDAEHAAFCARFGEIQAERTAPESESGRATSPRMLFVSNFKENAILPGGRDVVPLRSVLFRFAGIRDRPLCHRVSVRWRPDACFCDCYKTV